MPSRMPAGGLALQIEGANSRLDTSGSVTFGSIARPQTALMPLLVCGVPVRTVASCVWLTARRW
jgi:hypothetical protein